VIRIGMFGTGFIAKEAAKVVQRTEGLEIVKVLTRRPFGSVGWLDSGLLTHSVNEVIDACDLVFEATGDPIHSTVTVEAALRAGRKVVTMNSELHVTTGSFLSELGYCTEADGDQPGATALLERDAAAMGFERLAYVNIKGFLDPNPSPADMEYWSRRQKLSLVETTSFTDGTKLHVEQAFCANAFGATLARPGMIGSTVAGIHDTDELARRARQIGQPISDYVICPAAPPGVFILCDHPDASLLPHYGPYEKLLTRGREAYVLLRPYHLCGLEVAKSLIAAASGAPPLMTNGAVPKVSVAAVAKRPLSTDDIIGHAIGGFDVRGSALLASEAPDHVPIGLLSRARLRRGVPAGQVIQFDDVDLVQSRALEIWLDELRPRIASAA
jgi:predicted homoserine dehydrogenase-like protein